MPPWSVVWTERALKDAERLPTTMRRRVAAAVERYAQSEHGDMRRLQGVEPPAWRLRVGEYRVIVAFDYPAHVIRIRAVAGRGSVYRGL